MQTDDIARIAAGLTKAVGYTLLALSSEWVAGPDLSDEALDGLSAARASGLVERQFRDMGPPDTANHIDGFSIHIGACWWFRLTPLGLRVRAHIQDQRHD